MDGLKKFGIGKLLKRIRENLDLNNFIKKIIQKFINAIGRFCLRCLDQKRQNALINFSLAFWRQKELNRL
jgi:hypothetical protein